MITIEWEPASELVNRRAGALSVEGGITLPLGAVRIEGLWYLEVNGARRELGLRTFDDVRVWVLENCLRLRDEVTA